MKTFIILFVFFVLGLTPALAQKKVAVVKLLKGDVDLLTMGKTTKLKADQWVEEGDVVKTAAKSFVKLVFLDKSQMSIGPQSEMKIEKFSGKDSSVMELVKGKIRSQVTKDYLQIEDKNKSKLFIKTSNAVMGVRGTDFTIASNGKATSVVLFEGEVVFNRLDKRNLSSAALERIVDQGVRLVPGEFSVVEHKLEPTVPAILNPQQREKMEKNDSFEDKGDKEYKEKSFKSVVPEGLSGEVVSSESQTLKKEVLHDVDRKVEKGGAGDPNGFVQGEKMKPANGSFLHVDTGIIVPPAPDSVLDKNTNTYVAGSGNGTVAPNGDYLPPKNITITQDGKFNMNVRDDHGKVKQHEMERPMPVRLPDEGGLKLSEVKRPEEMGQFNHHGPRHDMDRQHQPRDFQPGAHNDHHKHQRDMMMNNQMEGIKDRMGTMPPKPPEGYQPPPPPPNATTDAYKPPPPPPAYTPGGTPPKG